MPTVGRYSASHASNHSSACSLVTGLRPGSSRSVSMPTATTATAADRAIPAAAHQAEAPVAVVSSPAVEGRPKTRSRCPGRCISSAGGAGLSRSAEASMFRVTTGRVRVRRTRIATAWHAKCRA